MAHIIRRELHFNARQTSHFKLLNELQSSRLSTMQCTVGIAAITWWTVYIISPRFQHHVIPVPIRIDPVTSVLTAIELLDRWTSNERRCGLTIGISWDFSKPTQWISDERYRSLEMYLGYTRTVGLVACRPRIAVSVASKHWRTLLVHINPSFCLFAIRDSCATLYTGHRIGHPF